MLENRSTQVGSELVISEEPDALGNLPTTAYPRIWRPVVLGVSSAAESYTETGFWGPRSGLLGRQALHIYGQAV
jgi:hypothetical protein